MSGYDAFCIADPLFYDIPVRGPESESYTFTDHPLPPGWRQSRDDDWVKYVPDDVDLPAQGWKIHVSGCLDNAERIIETVGAYCFARGCSFKFLRSQRVVLVRNAKYAIREGSGKLVTVYVRDEPELEIVAKELSGALAGEPGPYILSDLRWGEGPLHVRYGGFTPRYCKDDRGEIVEAIEDPSGDLVPDVRGPVFTVPSWVTIPDFLAPHMAARNAVTVEDLPYQIEEALHFSNGGGVYAAIDKRNNRRVVLKEARPHAGLSADGSDAVTRLYHERGILERLAGVEAVPEALDFFTIGEHKFLAMELIEGESLNQALVQRCPVVGTSVTEAAAAGYARWAMNVYANVERAIAEIHQRGVVYNDLHPSNIILRAADLGEGDDSGVRVALVDFEIAGDMETDPKPSLGAVGFAAPDRRGAERDRHALACLQLALFLPLEPILGLEPAKAADLADVVAEIFPVPRHWLDGAVEVIADKVESQTRPTRPRPRVEPDPARWPDLRGSVAEGILASATPDREDRLFPGDIAQFRTGGGHNLAHGAAGVLYALDVTGSGRHPDHEEWLVRQVEKPSPGTRLGFYDGLHGIAYVLAHLGWHDEAVTILDICLSERWESSGDDLYSGLAGMGLNFAHLAGITGDPALHDAALRATRLVSDRLGSVEDVPETSGGRHPYAGLLRGSAGRALLFIRMYERTREVGLLDQAAIALRQDLRRCVRRDEGRTGDEGGQLHVDEGWRTMPYLDGGSIGIGLVLRRYLAHREDDELARAEQGIRLAASSIFYAHSGLFGGRAGMVLYLSDGRRPGVPAAGDTGDQVRRLDWHGLTFQDHLAFPGHQLLRLSTDLATGSAGVLLALGAALGDRPVNLPFLGPPSP